MSSFDALLKESKFHWLAEAVKTHAPHLRRPQHARVQRMDLPFLRVEYDASLFARVYTAHFLFSRSGDYVAQIGVRERKLIHWGSWMFGPTINVHVKETVGPAISRAIEKSRRTGTPEPYFYVKIYGHAVGKLELFKPPKDFTLAEWLEHLEERERERITAEVRQELALSEET